jgi:hypothetical protein
MHSTLQLDKELVKDLKNTQTKNILNARKQKMIIPHENREFFQIKKYTKSTKN